MPDKKLQVSAGSWFAMKATILSAIVILSLVFSFAASADVLGYLLKALQFTGYVNIVSFVTMSIIFAYLLGKKAEIAIRKKTSGHLYISYKTGLLVITYSTLITSLLACGTTLVTTGLPADWFMLYFVVPLVWTISLSVLPIAIAGSWYGVSIINSPSK
jgi:hypothetical protein